MENNYIATTKFCRMCNNAEMKLIRNQKVKSWQCPNCSANASPLEDTILHNVKKPLNEIIIIIYFWSIDLTQKRCMLEGNTQSKKTCDNWYKKLSLQTYYIMKNLQRTKIGGIGHVIEVDESKFSKRKFNVGRAIRFPWILGGVDLETGDVFFVEVISRNKETINKIILENIELGTTIVTDCWSGYVDLNKLGYFHLTVNHSENFIDSLTGANTQSIENRWSVYKKKFKSRYINNPSDFSLLFAEFSFKLKFKDQSFSYFMQNLNKFD